MQNWVVIEENYLNFLRSFEAKIPFSNYGVNKLKPFFGVLFEVDDLVYVTQVSHPQARHERMKKSLDFYKIYLPSENASLPDRLIAVVNLNYMFPLPKSMLQVLEYKDIDQHRTFSSELEKSKYIDLLKQELSEINRMNLDIKAKRLYQLKLDHPENIVSKRCIDFKMLEEKALTYKSL